jgi:zinc protease
MCARLSAAGLAALLLASLTLPVRALPTIVTWQTGNGARVLFVEARDLPIVDVSLVFNAAAARDGDKPGVARITSALLGEGAAGLSADAIAERFAALGARFSTESVRDMASVSLRTLSDRETLAAALDLAAKAVTRPDFPPDALERVRRQMLVGLQQIEQSPDDLVEREFLRTLYRGHPYASPPEGTVASVTALGRDDVRAHWARYYVGRNVVVAIVGDLDRGAAEQLAETLVGSLPAGEPAPPLPSPPAAAPSQTVTVDHPSTQTHLRLGGTSITRVDPDFYPLYVGNHALGGSGLVSTLAEEVREKRGLSYSVFSSLTPMRAEGPFYVGLQTRNEQAGEALKVARETLERFVREGPSEDDLDAAKRNITGGFALRLDSNAKVLAQIASIGFYGLPLDYLATFTDRVNAVTPEAVREAFRRHIDLEHLVTVLVGKPDTSGRVSAAPAP